MSWDFVRNFHVATLMVSERLQLVAKMPIKPLEFFTFLEFERRN